MAKEENRFVNYLQENPKQEKLFICFLWLFIFVRLIKLLLLYPPLFAEPAPKPVQPEPVLALVLVNAVVVGPENEKYLTGYRAEYHQSDISNTATTPDVSAVLTAGSYLRYTYTITNYTQNKMLYWVDIIKDYQEKNLTISYSLNREEEIDLQKEYIAGQIDQNSTFVISFFVRILNESFDADLTGKFALNITYFAEAEI